MIFFSERSELILNGKGIFNSYKWLDDKFVLVAVQLHISRVGLEVGMMRLVYRRMFLEFRL